MDPQSDETGYVPAGPPAVVAARHRSVFHRRRFKAVGTIGALALTAALGLQFGNAAHAAPKPASRVAAISRLAGAQGSLLSANVAPDSDGSTGGTSGTGGEGGSGGGIHGSFSLYDGVGGGIEFWFDPNTGKITIAIGAGVGEGGDGVVGYYTPGTEPEEGMSDFADVTFGVGSVASFSASGDYSWESGKFSGSIKETVDGRTLTINSDGTGSLDVSVVAAEGTEGFEGATGVKYTFSFTAADVLKILQDIWDWLTGPEDEDYDDYYDDYYYSDGEEDVTGDDTTVTGDDSGTTDDGSADASDDGGDSGDSGGDSGGGDSGGGDGGGGGGGGGGSCDDYAEAESVALPDLEEPCDPEAESLVLTVHQDHSLGYAPQQTAAGR